MATLAEKWLETGKLEGLEQGLEQGIEQGREEGMRNSILTVLRTRFVLSDQASETVTQRLAKVSSLPHLEQLLMYALQDDSLDSFLRRLPY